MIEQSNFSLAHDFSVPEAQRLADLTGILLDLEAVEQLCSRLMAEVDAMKARPLLEVHVIGGEPEERRSVPNVGLEDWLFRDSLFAAAVVRYMRTHGTGVRYGIPVEWIGALPQSLQNGHKYLKNLRDKFIAHSVSALEDNQVQVFVRASDPYPSGVTGVSISPGRFYGGGDNDIALLQALVTSLRAKVKEEIRLETETVLSFARSLPRSVIQARGTEEGPLPFPIDRHAGLKREKFR